jgi:Gas vesicle protein G
MGVLTLLIRLPITPVEGVIKVGEIIRHEAEQQYYSAAAVRRRLEEAEQEFLAGRLSREQFEELEQEAVGRVAHVAHRRGSPDEGPQPTSEGAVS